VLVAVTPVHVPGAGSGGHDPFGVASRPDVGAASDGARMTEPAPDVIGLHPDDAARLCRQLGVDLQVDAVDETWMRTYFGEGQPWRITQQVPAAGRPLSSSRTLAVRVSVRAREGGAGAREPRRPTPPDRPIRADGPGD
jgi:hypothetical protein